MSKVFVGNLPATATEVAVRALFSQHGSVQDVAMINDVETGRSQRIAFVTMPTRDAVCAIQNLNGHEMDGHVLQVNEARDKPRHGGFRRPR